ncbi:MAG: hypothetical protein FWG12_03410 [Holophagaceae bacterium]|nr:hypothetical protein [Holophagaceae bacterium]
MRDIMIQFAIPTFFAQGMLIFSPIAQFMAPFSGFDPANPHRQATLPNFSPGYKHRLFSPPLSDFLFLGLPSSGS